MFGRYTCVLNKLGIYLPFSRLSSNITSSVEISESKKNASSSTWYPVPRDPQRHVVRMYPIRHRHKPRIVLVREGCVNRPFYTIQIKSNLAEAKQKGIEQVGSWDPFPNQHGEQLVALNLERIAHWISKGAEPSDRVCELLGLAGFFPVHPRSYLNAHRARIATKKYLDNENSINKDSAETDSNKSKNTDQGKDDSPRPSSVWLKNNDPSWWFHGLV